MLAFASKHGLKHVALKHVLRHVCLDQAHMQLHLLFFAAVVSGTPRNGTTASELNVYPNTPFAFITKL
jgi:hypothetical protein